MEGRENFFTLGGMFAHTVYNQLTLKIVVHASGCFVSQEPPDVQRVIHTQWTKRRYVS